MRCSHIRKSAGRCTGIIFNKFLASCKLNFICVLHSEIIGGNKFADFLSIKSLIAEFLSNMTTAYQPPLQDRAKFTEQRFLDALNQLLKERSLGHLTVENIADQAGLTRSAFLKRFGSKKQALFVLWARYCNRASEEMRRATSILPTFSSLTEVCVYMSQQLEAMQLADFSANRAMHEDFQENLRVDPQTKKLFLECVELMKKARMQFLHGSVVSEEGVFAAAQLLITINYNYVLKAMPGLPADPHQRHKMIGEIVALTLAR